MYALEWSKIDALCFQTVFIIPDSACHQAKANAKWVSFFKSTNDVPVPMYVSWNIWIRRAICSHPSPWCVHIFQCRYILTQIHGISYRHGVSSEKGHKTTEFIQNGPNIIFMIHFDWVPPLVYVSDSVSAQHMPHGNGYGHDIYKRQTRSIYENAAAETRRGNANAWMAIRILWQQNIKITTVNNYIALDDDFGEPRFYCVSREIRKYPCNGSRTTSDM